MATKNLPDDFFKVKPKNFSETGLVKEYFVDGAWDGLFTIEAACNSDLNIATWLEAHRATVLSKLSKYGAILFRGFKVMNVESFQVFMDTWSKSQIFYVDQSSPRTLIDNKIYTSTDHPPTEIIKWHSELSYSHQWPQFVAFNCHLPAYSGGETFISDNRKLLKELPPKIVEKFVVLGILYERNLIPGLGLSWKKVYQTDDRIEVERYCSNQKIEFEWLDENYLRLKWRRPAIVKHIVTNESVWFNHGYFFNAFNLEKHIKSLLDDSSLVPFNTYYGNGEPIEQNVLKLIKDAYKKNTISLRWQKGDLLLLDNMLMSHGRNKFNGERKIVVSMTNPIQAHQVI